MHEDTNHYGKTIIPWHYWFYFRNPPSGTKSRGRPTAVRKPRRSGSQRTASPPSQQSSTHSLVIVGGSCSGTSTKPASRQTNSCRSRLHRQRSSSTGQRAASGTSRRAPARRCIADSITTAASRSRRMLGIARHACSTRDALTQCLGPRP